MIKNFYQRLDEIFLNCGYHHLTEYWGTKGAGVLVICSSTNRILMQKRGQYVQEGGTWGVIGGAIEGIKDEEAIIPMEGAKKELREETGYNGSLKMIPAYVYRKEGFEYHNFIGVVPQEFQPNPPPEHRWETEKFEWMSFEEMMTHKDNFHFGLKALLKNSGDIIIKFADNR